MIFARRISGRIAFSRSFGDFKYKQPKTAETAGPLISNEPEIRELYLNLIEDEFLLIACDGLWDVLSSQAAVDFVRSKFLRLPVTEQDPQRVARELVNEAIYERKSSDNVTVMIVMLTCGVVA